MGKKHPDLIGEFKKRLNLFSQDPFFPSLKTHTLHGDLIGLWAI
jgi:mRNA-degrading endonuclease YafQ of YafQ-DinJ toxin-antitoxin module